MNTSISRQLPLVMVGAGGHARVLHALAVLAGYRFVGVCDPELAARNEGSWLGVPVLGGDEALSELDPGVVGVVNGVGQLPDSGRRRAVYERIGALGFRFPPLVHTRAWVADSVRLEDGAQIMAGAVIQPDCSVGRDSIVNTSASVDHDCTIGAHVHIAPGATLCGGVIVGDGAFIGSGSTIIQSVSVGNGATVWAGAVLTKDLGDRELARWVPRSCAGRG